jgi:ribonuclease P/MRP protein subunit POP5
LIRNTANQSVKYFSPATSAGIVRVSRQHFRIVWAALTYINNVAGHNVIIRVVRVSGTIRKCQQAAISMDKSSIVKQKGTALMAFEERETSEEEREEEDLYGQ